MWLIVENEIITNIILADEAFADEIGALPCYEGARIGEAYAPPPEPEPQPDPQADTDAMVVDLEYRLTLLELGVN